MSTMLKSSGAMGVATLSSRVLGMIREMVYAAFLGTSWVASAFFLAYQIPNLFRRLLGEGALTAAFIPIFKEKEKTEGDTEMWRAANAVISGLVVATASLTALALLVISLVLAIGSFHPKTRLMLELLRVMFPYMLLVCLAAIFMGMLNARGYFFIPALGATMLNLVMIGSVLFLAPHLGSLPETQIFGLAIGLVFAGIAQACFQLPTLHKEGYRYQWVSPWTNDTVRQVVRKMIPATIGVAAFQINVITTQGFAFWYGPGIVASFNYAVRLMELPQGVFGVSLATYLLPTLSGLASEKNFSEFRTTLKEGLSYLTFVNLITAAFLLVLAEPIVRLLFERKEFTSQDTQRVAFTVASLAPGLVFFSAVNILARAFYALGDIQTPMKISIVCLGLNAVFALFLIGAFREAGLGIANTMSAAFNVWLLSYALKRKLRSFEMKSLRQPFLYMLGAALLAGEIALLINQTWEKRLGHQDLFSRVGAVFVPMATGGLIYWIVTYWLKIGPALEVVQLISRRLRKLSKR
jgi:putative peptidoglycan lipid II flippase